MLSLLSLISPMRRNDQTASMNKNLKKFLCTLFILCCVCYFAIAVGWCESVKTNKREKKELKIMSLTKKISQAPLLEFGFVIVRQTAKKVTFGAVNETQRLEMTLRQHYLHIQLSFSALQQKKKLNFQSLFDLSYWGVFVSYANVEGGNKERKKHDFVFS